MKHKYFFHTNLLSSHSKATDSWFWKKCFCFNSFLRHGDKMETWFQLYFLWKSYLNPSGFFQSPLSAYSSSYLATPTHFHFSWVVGHTDFNSVAVVGCYSPYSCPVCTISKLAGPSSTVTFTLKSAYLWLHIHLYAQHRPALPWRFLWKSILPPKLQFFLWFLIHRALPTVDLLFHYHKLKTPICTLCELDDCNTHIYFGCPVFF